MRIFLILLGAVVLLVLVRMSLFTVDPTEYVYVTEFGRHLATYDGSDAVNDAGLHWRWPWPIQSIQRVDRRLQMLDLQEQQLLTHDAAGKTIDKNLMVSAFVCWQIAGKDNVDLFLRRFGDPLNARRTLADRVNAQLGAEIARRNLDELISTEPGQVEKAMQQLRQAVMAAVDREIAREYGIQVVDVRLRRFNHPQQVRDAIFARIRSERAKKVEEYRSKGEKAAKEIRSTADAEVRETLAKARYDEETIKGAADTAATLIRNQAHNQDPEFYAFLKRLEKLQTILGDNRTVLLLSSHRQMFDLLFQPPQLQGSPAPALPPAPTAGSKQMGAMP